MGSAGSLAKEAHEATEPRTTDPPVALPGTSFHRAARRGSGVVPHLGRDTQLTHIQTARSGGLGVLIQGDKSHSNRAKQSLAGRTMSCALS